MKYLFIGLVIDWFLYGVRLILWAYRELDEMEQEIGRLGAMVELTRRDK